ncbi:U-box domain-containing protein 6-like [Nymphaea colorata]|nr:U-box domain-containing protein 6-like [Nymphaea colorata]XP_031494771.1 U-box domain-containing protein 6-like [Nymphaea colorata]XP_031494773.1 U-box domain-containing protein 6-like [Nymphaea colorata]
MGNMDASEVEESVFAITDAKLHGGMCRKLSSIVCKVMAIFPVIEEARPRCKSGIQALCSLHVALEKSKSLLQHCADCSKLYLAITGDSVLLKFEKTRHALEESLKRVEDIVPHVTSCQIMSIVNELQATVFALDPLEKQVGDDVILLLHQDRNCGSSFNEMSEIEAFHQAAIKLGITSLASALAERRALKKLVERARYENDKRKESIVSYLLHLMRKYSKLFRSECPDDVDSMGSTPCSPTIQGSIEEGAGSAQAVDGQLRKFESLNIKPNGRRSGNIPVSPEEFRCPISLQLMYDPVIIASGQTYERVCIENWFSNGHDTCPKTQQKLSHLSLTPNYCVKGLIASWCEQNGVRLPDQPPDSLDLDYWRWNLSQCENINPGSTEDNESSHVKGAKVVPLEDNGDLDGLEKHEEMGTQDICLENIKISLAEGYQRLLDLLNSEEDIETKCKAAEEIRFLLKDNEEARICMGETGFADALVRFLRTGVQQRNEKAQETGTMALFNLAVGNDKNKELVIGAGVLPLLEEIQQTSSYEAGTALYLNLSCLHEAKATIGSSGAIPFLVGCLRLPKTQCRFDALQAVYNLSTLESNIPRLLAAGVVANLAHILSGSGNTWPDKVIAVLCNLASTKQGRTEIIMFPGLLGSLALVLDSGTQVEQEQAVSCLLSLCVGDEQCSQLVLQEGVVPSLVSLSINGTSRGKDKAQKLLVHFRGLRERDPVNSSSQPLLTTNGSTREEPVEREVKSVVKFKSKSNRLGRVLSSMWKVKSLSIRRF